MGTPSQLCKCKVPRVDKDEVEDKVEDEDEVKDEDEVTMITPPKTLTLVI